jgi:hypothetical protein
LAVALVIALLAAGLSAGDLATWASLAGAAVIFEGIPDGVRGSGFLLAVVAGSFAAVIFCGLRRRPPSRVFFWAAIEKTPYWM